MCGFQFSSSVSNSPSEACWMVALETTTACFLCTTLVLANRPRNYDKILLDWVYICKILIYSFNICNCMLGCQFHAKQNCLVFIPW
jgi:hypothetical protein